MVSARTRVNFGQFEELWQGALGSSRVVPISLGEEIELSLDAHDGGGEVGQAGEVAREVSGAHPASGLRRRKCSIADQTPILQFSLEDGGVGR